MAEAARADGCVGFLLSPLMSTVGFQSILTASGECERRVIRRKKRVNRSNCSTSNGAIDEFVTLSLLLVTRSMSDSILAEIARLTGPSALSFYSTTQLTPLLPNRRHRPAQIRVLSTCSVILSPSYSHNKRSRWKKQRQSYIPHSCTLCSDLGRTWSSATSTFAT